MPNEDVNSQAKTPQEPQDIAQAFQMVRENQQTTAQPVKQEEQASQEKAGDGEQQDQRGQDAVAQGATGFEPAAGGNEFQVSAEPAIGGGAGSIGGPAARGEQNDYAALQNNLIASLQNEAQQNVLKKFHENEIKLMDIGDIYERREDGTVIFNNPDNPNRPFESREQAQAWINSMNQQIQNAFNQEVYKEQQELYKNATPAINLIQFAPLYDSMPEITQNIFDDLIEPYSITNADGDVIGFDCDLSAMARQASALVERYGFGRQAQQEQSAQQQAKQQSSDPAMDLKSGNGASADDAEPTNIAEAMAMLNKQRKENRNGK